jgi:acyl-CoA thioesterase-1
MRAFVSLAVLVLQLMAGEAAASERVIVAFGDSLTAGLGVPADETYPARLGERLRRGGYDYKVVNAGVSGDTTAGGLRRVEWALRLKPEIVILELGVNDALRGQKLTSVRANLEQLVTRFQAAGARAAVLCILWCGKAPRDRPRCETRGFRPHPDDTLSSGLSVLCIDHGCGHRVHK